MNSVLRIEKTENLGQIREAMYICAEVFFDQTMNNSQTIEPLAEKYKKYARFCTLYCGDEIGGFVAFYCNAQTQDAYISMIMVRKKYQRSGAGRQLLEHTVAVCRNEKQKKLRLEVATDNDKALAFYKKNGFIREGSASEKTDYYALLL